MASEAIAAPPQLAPPPGAKRVRKRRDSLSSWPLIDRVAYVTCWAVGIGLCLVTAWIVLYMFVKGVSYLSVKLLLEHPNADARQAHSGGILDPIEGTLLIAGVGIVIAAPVGIAMAVWMSEYARPAWLARAAESSVEMISGAPSVLLALFGLIVFARPVLAFLSQTSAGGTISGKSFFTAGAMMSLIALPLVVTATREALMQVPTHLREASHALGKTQATTIRRVLLPSVRPSIASGITLGVGRIVGDTAIIVILLGAGLRIEGAGGAPGLSTLRGIGGTLTSYVRYFSPAGEGNQYEKAYAAAFVLMAMVVALNLIVTMLSKGRPTGRRGLKWTR
ncbi:MAG TPA: ABC transporter permease subunit [Solirubrobacteraceae bacterium]|jgi:phosphate transport system permease protein|nr:ABC transporter permease subunit [Solirubrobacteraceae bacterium]